MRSRSSVSISIAPGLAEHGGYPYLQLHLIERKFSWSHINQVACALRFFYGITLGQKEAFEPIVSGKKPGRTFGVMWVVITSAGRPRETP
jgi:hypothetical protein